MRIIRIYNTKIDEFIEGTEWLVKTAIFNRPIDKWDGEDFVHVYDQTNDEILASADLNTVESQILRD
ncbi:MULTISPECIES: hypothetical protein [unclassified Oceanobacillus]|uniref:hypothetical protein n=1 Tax=unclassified Oceanobacillus TaxID=2630292 RepID=UPI001BEAEC14|nr:MULTISPECIES: hypothetical protein [unclassified Oceanobacillus]MBT2600911.1 hypothetical protein [Oceanobacillus sp. ISL-74]MBT2653428.1 hypothetical protein [Oceanobacillus sp. ISL-73]